MFASRDEAGRRLAETLIDRKDDMPVVLAMPPGGLAVAAPVAQRLDAPLDVLLVRRMVAPSQPDLTIGAVADGPEPTLVRMEPAIRRLGLTEAEVEASAKSAGQEIARWRQQHRGYPALSVAERTVVLVDDGMSTGARAEAALMALRKQNPKRLVLAVPVAPAETVARLRTIADAVVCLRIPVFFGSVASQYADFPRLTDDDVMRLLHTPRVEGNAA